MYFDAGIPVSGSKYGVEVLSPEQPGANTAATSRKDQLAETAEAELEKPAA